MEKDKLHFRGWVDYHFGKMSLDLFARPSGRDRAKNERMVKINGMQNIDRGIFIYCVILKMQNFFSLTSFYIITVGVKC